MPGIVGMKIASGAFDACKPIRIEQLWTQLRSRVVYVEFGTKQVEKKYDVIGVNAKKKVVIDNRRRKTYRRSRSDESSEMG